MIPVTFNKDDLNNPKKGTVSPEAMSALVGLLYPTQVGVLDIFENPVAVTNVDLSTTGYATLTFSKGYVVCYGRLIYVEQGEQATLPLPASNETGNLGIRINLTESGASEVEWFAKSGTLVTNNLLNEPATGVYEIKLYTYTATSSSFAVGTRVATKVANMNDYLKGTNFNTRTTADRSNAIATTSFVQSLVAENRTEVYIVGGTVHIHIKGANDTTVLTIVSGRYNTPAGQTTGYVQLPFESVCYSVVASPINDSQDRDWMMLIKSYSKSGFTYKTTADRCDCMYIAFGV